MKKLFEIITRVKSDHKLIFVLLGLIASILISLPYLKPGLPVTDDGTLMVIRATGFHESFMDGHFPVRWIQRLNENFGYPVMNFLYPLPFYMAEAFQLIGFSALNAVKAVFVFSSLLSFIGMYLFLSFLLYKKTKKKKSFDKYTSLIALTGALTYLIVPYRLIDMFDRGSLGEVVAFAIFPFILYFFQRWRASRQILDVVGLIIMWALLIPAHNSIALILSGFFFVYGLLHANQDLKSQMKEMVVFTGVVALLSAWFWLPALYDLSFTRSSSISIANVLDHFTSLPMLLVSIGYLVLAILAYASLKLKKNRENLYLIGVSLIAIVLQFPIVAPLWNTLKLDTLIQFPFRFLSLLVIITPILLVKSLANSPKKLINLVLLGISSLFLFQVVQLSQIENQIYPQGYFEANFDSTTNQDEFTPKDVRVDPTTYAEKFYEVHGSQDMYKLVEAFATTQEKFLQFEMRGPIKIIFNTHYFPGWQLYVDDEKTEFVIDEYGRPVIEIERPERRNRSSVIKLVWSETPLRQTANYVSAITLLLLVSLAMYSIHSGNKKKTLATISGIVLLINIISAIFVRVDSLSQKFDPKIAEEKYLQSQWVNPDSATPIGDHGLYAWASWAYLHGTDPTLINSEVPPLGKYILGVSLFLTRNTSIVGIFYSLVFLLFLYCLANVILKDKWLAIIPVTLFSFEVIFRSSITYTMLDSIQMSFLVLAFIGMIRADKNWKWLILAVISLGGVLSTKFYITGFMATISCGLYLLVTKRWELMKKFLLLSPIIFLVHTASYLRYFWLGHTFRQYLGAQKWILNFYRSGSPDVPFGSYWGLVFLNKWRVWWGPRFGEYYTLVTKEWNILWPINAGVVGVAIINFIKSLKSIWLDQKKTKIAPEFVLVSWLACYSAFLTLIGGWPHYMLLFLPFSNILMVKLISEHSSKILKLTSNLRVLKDKMRPRI